MTLSIEVYFDFICPWCLIGKRQLDQALAQLRVAQPEVQVAVSWRGVQLLPALLLPPVLLTRPILVPPRGALLCRPAERVLELLPAV